MKVSFSLLLVSCVVWTVVFPGNSSAQKPVNIRHQYYVSIEGTSSVTDPRAGSRQMPWNLQTALNHPSKVRPGDVIFIKKGVYKGNFISRLAGTQALPVQVTAMVPQSVLIEPDDKMKDSLVVSGSWAVYRGLRIYHTNPRTLLTEGRGINHMNLFDQVVVENLSGGLRPLNVKGAVRTVDIQNGHWRTVFRHVYSGTVLTLGIPGAVLKPSVLIANVGRSAVVLLAKCLGVMAELTIGTKDAYADGAIPNMPEEVTAYAVSNSMTVNTAAVVVKWADSSNTETGFQVERSTNGIDFVLAGSSGANIRMCKITGLAGNTGYFFRVLGKGTDGNSVASDPVYVKTAGYLTSARQIGYANTELIPVKLAVNAVGEKAIYGQVTGAAVLGMTTLTDTFFIAKIDAAGQFQWVKPLDGEVYTVKDIAIAATGDIAVAGQNDQHQLFVTKLASLDGAVLWNKTKGGFNSGAGTINDDSHQDWHANAVVFDAAGANVYVAGGYVLIDNNYTHLNYGVIEKVVSASGVMMESANFTGTSTIAAANGPSKSAELYDISVSSNGNVVSTGYMSYQTSTLYREDLLVRIGTANKVFNGMDADNPTNYGYSLAIDKSNNIFVLADRDDDRQIYKLTSAGAKASGFPVPVGGTLISTFSGAASGVDAGGNFWIVSSEDIREYSSTGVLLMSKAEDDQNSTYILPSIRAAAMAGNSMLVSGDLAGRGVFEQFSLDSIGDRDIFLVQYSSLDSFTDEVTSPVGTISGRCDSYCRNGIVDLSVSAISNTGMGSGTKMRFSNDNNVWGWSEDYAVDSYIPLSAGDGNRQAYVQFMDRFHNWSGTYASNSFLVDRTPPAGSIAINGGALKAASADVTLTLTAIDAQTSVAGMKISNTIPADWSSVVSKAFTPSVGWTLPTGDGNKTVFVKFIDVAGNVSETYSAAIVLEQLPVTYDQWKVLKFGPGCLPAACGLEMDPDADGMTNIQEYMANTDPFVKNVLFDAMRSYFEADQGGVEHFVIKLRRNKAVTDYEYKPRGASGVVGPWDYVFYSGITVEAVDQNTEWVKYTERLAKNAPGMRIYKVDILTKSASPGSGMRVKSLDVAGVQAVVLNVTRADGGTVISDPGGIDCGNTCRMEVPFGVKVTLSARPAGNYLFKGWSGGCAGMGACQLTMNESKSVAAIFAAVPPCGNGVVDPGEQCDPAFVNSRAATCADLKLPGWTRRVGCSSECRLDVSACVPVCGDGVVEGAEQCDGSNLSGQTCAKYGFDAGEVRCSSDCRRNISRCFNDRRAVTSLERGRAVTAE